MEFFQVSINFYFHKRKSYLSFFRGLARAKAELQTYYLSHLGEDVVLYPAWLRVGFARASPPRPL